MIVFASNYYNHHQAPLCEALYRLSGGAFRFIATEKMEEERLEMGWGGEEAPFVLSYPERPEDCQSLIDRAQLLIWGHAPYQIIKNRLRKKLLTLAYSERIYKDSYTSWQVALRRLKYYWKYGRHENFYLLCASAYTALDYAKTWAFRGRAYRWGYFPQVKTYSIEQLISQKQRKEKPLILWVGRLIELKHPEAALYVANSLKKEGLDFSLDIIGSGELGESLKQQISSMKLEDKVRLLGSMKPQEVRAHMEQADIFLFTSDRGEGWGAVLNEAMNSGCAVVASHAIGSVPFLLEHGKNGMIYQDGCLSSLCSAVRQLLLDAPQREHLGKSAYETMASLWNAETAASRLLQLVEALAIKGSSPYSEGPCSPSPLLDDLWFCP